MTDPHPTCVFTLHRITDMASKTHDVSWASYRRFLADVVHAKADVAAALETGASKPRIVLTFDDATVDHLAAAAELRTRGMTGIFFVPTSAIAKSGHLTGKQIAELALDGHLIGSHSDRHLPLSSLSARQLDRELARSRDRLTELIGSPPCYFAPPGGVGHPSLRSALQRHGFVASRSMRWGIYEPGQDPWGIRCIPITEATLARGWANAAMTTWRLPTAMRAASMLKNRLPRPVSNALRHVMHAAVRTT